MSNPNDLNISDMSGAANSSFGMAATNGASGSIGTPIHSIHYYKLEALRLASDHCPVLPPVEVTKRAQVYYDFLIGKEA